MNHFFVIASHTDYIFACILLCKYIQEDLGIYFIFYVGCDFFYESRKSQARPDARSLDRSRLVLVTF